MSACSLEEHQEQIRKKWRVGASYAFTSTSIRFNDDLEPDQQRHIALASVAYRPSSRWTLEVGAGSLFAGQLRTAERKYDFEPGVLLMLGASWRVLDNLGARPFVLVTSQFAYNGARTESDTASEVGYHAFDLRLGGVAGWTLWRVVSPYALVRAFGGPVLWKYRGSDETGTDIYHYQVGGGVLALLFQRVDLFVEGVPLGEQAIAVGAGFIF